MLKIYRITVAVALLLLFVRLLLFNLYRIPSRSMAKTLLINDIILVQKYRLPWLNLPYYEWLYGKLVERNDVVVFELADDPQQADTTIPYLKRCVAIGGDTLQIIDRQLWVNHQKVPNPPLLQYDYLVRTTQASPILEALDNSESYELYDNLARISLTQPDLLALAKDTSIEIDTIVRPKGVYAQEEAIFPYSPSHFPWNMDNYGSLVVPKKGDVLPLNSTTINLYRAIISTYEGNDLSEVNGQYLINGQVATHYTVQQNYYFMLGDNRHNSYDSRFLGFVPQDHLIGKAQYVLWSWDNFLNNHPKRFDIPIQ